MRLLIIEDEPALAGLLRTALGRAGFAVDHAGSIAAAREYLDLAAYDVLVLDRSLPDGDGLDLLRLLRRKGNAVPVLVLTARDAPQDRVDGLDGGADDYLVKPFHMDELVSRLRALLRRPSAALGTRLEFGDLALDTISREASVGDAALALSSRETTLLEMLLRRAGRVVSREALDQGLYGFDSPATPNAVEVLVYRLRRRLLEGGSAVSVHTIRGVGYLLAALE